MYSPVPGVSPVLGVIRHLTTSSRDAVLAQMPAPVDTGAQCQENMLWEQCAVSFSAGQQNSFSGWGGGEGRGGIGQGGCQKENQAGEGMEKVT